jgi:hypothetical protein
VLEFFSSILDRVVALRIGWNSREFQFDLERVLINGLNKSVPLILVDCHAGPDHGIGLIAKKDLLRHGFASLRALRGSTRLAPSLQITGDGFVDLGHHNAGASELR